MAKNTKDKKQFKKKLTHKYRMVVINEDTFEEKVTFKLSRLNVFVFGGLLSISLIILTVLLIAFSPLKEYIPGYAPVGLEKKATDLAIKIDSLEQELEVNNIYIFNIKEALLGDVASFKFDSDSVFETIRPDEFLSVDATANDSLFRLEVDRVDRYSFFEEAKKDVGIVFFSPISGIITADYDINKKHFAVDVAVKTGTPVKAIAEGTVIFAEWTAATGNVIILEHAKRFISIYKHNGSLLKQQGDLVKSGEVIASSGSTGELTTGPHLHFELWSDGYPVNPINFIDFE